MFKGKTVVKRGLVVNIVLVTIFLLSMMSSCFYNSSNTGLALETTQNNKPQDKDLVSASLPPSVNYSLISNWSEKHFSVVRDVEVIGDIAYIADEEAFILYNISNSAHPSLISRIRYPEDRYIKKIEVEGNLAFLVTSVERNSYLFNAIDIYNISDPSNPLKLELFLNYYIVDFYIQDIFLYVTTLNDGLMIIDFSDPTSLEIVSTWGSTHRYSRLLVSGDYLFLSDFDRGLIILDISDKAVPIEIFSGFFINEICSLYLEDNYLYLLNDEFLAIVTIYSITEPNLINLYNIDANIYSFFNAIELVVNERMVYVLSGSGVIYIIDAFNVGNPIYINQIG
ncbi:MAG: LVIVD repeat-containing protein, partial [Candidatus Heimdallarchaeota archaeon]